MNTDPRKPLFQARRVDLDPAKFYALVRVVRSVTQTDLAEIRAYEDVIDPMIGTIDDNVQLIAKAANAIMSEERRFRRRQDMFSGERDPLDDVFDDRGSSDFLGMVFTIIASLQEGYHHLYHLTRSLRPGTLILRKDEFTATVADFSQLQHMMVEFDINKPILDRFVNAVFEADEFPERVAKLATRVRGLLEGYYRRLLHRHSVDGIEIQAGNPVATDLAMTIFDNVDANGEIQDGKDPKEVSAYTIRKAEMLASTLKTGLVSEFIHSPSAFTLYVTSTLTSLYQVAQELQRMFKSKCEDLEKALNQDERRPRKKNALIDLALTIQEIQDIDPQNITFREKTVMLSPEERFNLKFRNETIKRVVTLLTDSFVDDASVIEYILERKAELRRYFQEENSFYVCKMGQGNPFTGEAPGALSVVPGSRPKANLDEIIGSGFDEVKKFFGSVESSSKFADLFLATSPSRSVDKSNVLLVGPMGCGKTEILRAVGADKKSLGIFAQGSDFNTCWKGEAEKNPKRLFEEGLRLQKESKKHVHFLIDEIDSVLNKDKEYGAFNLTLEFQILMDGVVEYPNLSVWGATNNPERIPMPMIRRFAKVVIVGELSQAERVKLLRHFVSFLPSEDISEEAWADAAQRLEGATGDVIRKVADSLWRDKMATFTRENEAEAEKLVKFLNEGSRFNVRDFSSDRKKQFHSILKPFVHVSSEDLKETIDMALDNIAIHNEIETAKATYAKAKAFLSSLHKTKKSDTTGFLKNNPTPPRNGSHSLREDDGT